MFCKCRLSIAVLTASLAASTTLPARAQDAAVSRGAPGSSGAIRLSGPAAAPLRVLLEGAYARLAEPRCQAVFSRLRDAERQPLQRRLETLGHTPQSYLALVMFYDGSGLERCHGDHVLAVATPGSRVVFVCSGGLQKWARSRPAWAEAAVIHEVLHTLGLGENPPSSSEINGAVLEACWP